MSTKPPEPIQWSIVLYAHPNPPARSLSEYVEVRPNRLWVRTEALKCDVETALSRAKPRLGETVLNSVPLFQDP